MTKEDKAEMLRIVSSCAWPMVSDHPFATFADRLADEAARLSAPDEQSAGAPPAPVTEGPHDDLVKRLHTDADSYDIYGVHGPLRREAATLIERLSAPPQDDSVKRWLELNPHDCDSPAIYMAEMKERGDAMAASIGRLEEKLVLFDAIRKESIERREKLEAAEARLKAAEEVVEAVGPALSCALLGLQVAADSVPLTHAHIENNIYLMCQTINRHLARLSIDVLPDGRRVDTRLPLTERLLALTARKEGG